MELRDAIDLDNLHNYSNVDFSKIAINYDSCEHIGTFEFTKLCTFIDIFDDVNKFTYGHDSNDQMSFAGYIIF